MARQYRRITYDDRTKIAGWVATGARPPEIAERLGVHIATVYRELARGGCGHRADCNPGAYDPERAQRALR